MSDADPRFVKVLVPVAALPPFSVAAMFAAQAQVRAPLQLLQPDEYFTALRVDGEPVFVKIDSFPIPANGNWRAHAHLVGWTDSDIDAFANAPAHLEIMTEVAGNGFPDSQAAACRRVAAAALLYEALAPGSARGYFWNGECLLDAARVLQSWKDHLYRDDAPPYAAFFRLAVLPVQVQGETRYSVRTLGARRFLTRDLEIAAPVPHWAVPTVCADLAKFATELAAGPVTDIVVQLSLRPLMPSTLGDDTVAVRVTVGADEGPTPVPAGRAVTPAGRRGGLLAWASRRRGAR